MKKLAKIKEYIYKEKNNYFLVLLFMIFAFICGSNVAMAKAAGLSTCEFVLLCITDHYYIIYGLFFYGIYWMFKDSKDDLELEIIRYGSYNRYYMIRCCVALVKIIIYVLCHILIASIIGVCNFGLSFDFNGHEIENYYNSALEFLLAFRYYFNNPIIAVISVGAYLILGMFFIYELLFYVQKIKGNKYEIIMMAVILVNVMLGFKLEIDESLLEVLFINNYFILHHCLFYCGKVAVWVNVLIIIMMSLLLNRIAFYTKHAHTSNRNKYIQHMISDKGSIIVFVLIILLIRIVPIITDDYNAIDYLLTCVQGFSSESINIINLLYYLAYFMFPMFALACFLENERQERTLLAKIRYKNISCWNKSIRRNCFKYIISYSFYYWGIQLVSTLLIYILTSEKSSKFWDEFLINYSLNSGQLRGYIVYSIILHITELIILFELMYLLHKKTKNTIISFLVSFSGYLFTVLHGENAMINPFGASSLYNIIGKHLNIGTRTFVVCLLWIVIINLIRSFLYENSNRIKKC